MFLLRVVIFICLLFQALPLSTCAFPLAAEEADRSVSVDVVASWAETPLLQEAVEWAARGGMGRRLIEHRNGKDFSERRFDGFAFLEMMWSRSRKAVESSAASLSQKKQFDVVLSSLKSFEGRLEDSEIDSWKARTTRFEVEMSARVYSPAVTAHYSLAADAVTSLRASPQYAQSARELTSYFCSAALSKPFMLLYAPGVQHPQLVHSMDEVRKAWSTVGLYNKKDGKTEDWRRELWLGEDSSGLSFLHPFSFTPSLAEASMVVVLFGLPLEKETMQWYHEMKDWLHQLEQHKLGSRPNIRFLFGHLPFLSTSLCLASKPTDKEKELYSGAQNMAEYEHWSQPLHLQGYGTSLAPATHVSNLTEAEGLSDEGQIDKAMLEMAVLFRLHDLYKKSSWESKAGLDSRSKLDILVEMTQRFPALVELEETMDSNSHRVKDLQEEIKALHTITTPGEGMMFLGRKRLNLETLSIFSVLREMRSEEDYRDNFQAIFSTRIVKESDCVAAQKLLKGRPTLTNFSLPAAVDRIRLQRTLSNLKKEVVKAGHHYFLSQQSPSSFDFTYIPSRIAVDPSLVFWLNDVEKDSVTQGFSPSLKSLATLTNDHGGHEFPRKNIFNFVAVLDPAVPSTLSILKMYFKMLDEGVPFHLGILFVESDWATPKRKSRDRTISKENALSLLEDTFNFVEKILNSTRPKSKEKPTPSLPEKKRKRVKRSLSGSATMRGSFLMVLDAMLYMQENEGREGVIKFLKKLVHTLEPLNMPASSASSSPVVEENLRKRNFLTKLHEIVRFASDSNRDHKKAREKLASVYSQLEKISSLFPTNPVVLLNGLIIKKDTSIFHCVLKEAQVLRSLHRDRVITDRMSTSELAAAIDKYFHSVRRIHPSVDRPSELTFWRGGTQTLSWIPSLLAFYEKRQFLRTGVYLGRGMPPVSAVSGVLIFPRSPSLLTLKMLEKTLDAAEEVGSTFRVTFLTSPSCANVRKEESITQKLELLLTSDAVETIMQENFIASQKEGNSSATSPHGLLIDRKRISIVKKFIQIVISTAKKEDLPMETELTNSSLVWPVDDRLVASSLKFEDAELGRAMELVARKAKGKDMTDQNSLIYQQQLCQVFHHYLNHQIEAQSAVGQWLGREPSTAVNRNKNKEEFDPSPLVLIVHGRAIPLDTTMEASDIAEVVYRVLPFSATLKDKIQEIDFLKLSVTPNAASFTAEDMSNPAFFSARVAVANMVLIGKVLVGDSSSAIVDRLPAISSSNLTAISISSPSPNLVRHRLTLIVDPTARDAVQLLSIAHFFSRSSIGVDLRIYLSPGGGPLPLSFYYQLVSQPQLEFDTKTGAVVQPVALFRSLPTGQALELEMIEPFSWNLVLEKGDGDMDYIDPASISPNDNPLSFSFILDSFAFTGYVLPREFEDRHFEELPTPLSTADRLILSLRPYESIIGKNATPATTEEYGTAFSLAVREKTKDTAVLSKEGYYQFSVLPGIWTISPYTTFSDYFYLDFVESRHTARDAGWWMNVENYRVGQRVPLLVDSFDLPLVRMTYNRVWKHEWDMAKNVERSQNSSSSSKMKVSHRLVINTPSLNVLCIASGHEEEELLKIMMYSVYQSSALSEEADVDSEPHLVKFWLLEQYLTPDIKKLAIKMAVYYGFEVDFVTYHWPHWLPRPSSKQKRLEAYKVLFLDALLPYQVTKAIVLDPSKISREDLHNLYRLDFTQGGRRRQRSRVPDEVTDLDTSLSHVLLEEAPTLAMAPFCSGSRKNSATLYLRTWENQESYINNLLHGLPYHSSGVFLVDIERFRARLNGKTYREGYLLMKEMEGKIESIDQDLVNVLQVRVPIYSLREEWVWCSTWCSTENLSKAKIVDLCHNPLDTTRSKMERAKSLFPDWDEVIEILEGLAQAPLNASYASLARGNSFDYYAEVPEYEEEQNSDGPKEESYNLSDDL